VPSEHRTTYRLAPGTGPHYLEETHEDSYALPRGMLLMMMVVVVVVVLVVMLVVVVVMVMVMVMVMMMM